MNVKTIRNSIRMKKVGALLALVLSICMLFEMGITAKAAETKNWQLTANNLLPEGTILNEGDVLKVDYVSEFDISIDGSSLSPVNTVENGYRIYKVPVGKQYKVQQCRCDEISNSSYPFGHYYVYLETCIKPSVIPPTNNIKEDDTAENQNQAASYYQSDAHIHTFSWVTVQEAGAGQDGLEEYRCACGLVEGRNTIPGSQAAVSQFKDMIESAPAGEKISFDTGRLYTLSDSIIKKLAERNDVSAEITFEYQGKGYKMTIPAGADYTAILGDEENFYGYFYFAQLIGAVIEEI